MTARQLDLLSLVDSDPLNFDSALIRRAILNDGKAHGGLVDSNRVREALRHVSKPGIRHKRIGAAYSAMRQQGLIVKRGYIESTDREGRNVGKPVPRWALTEAGWAA